MKINRKINICMSGGRTSAYLTEKVLELRSQGYFNDCQFIITFANTSKEHEKTLEFVSKCDERWRKVYGAGVTWLEAQVHSDRLPSSHKITCFKGAKRNGEVFENVVIKYGLPNSQFLHCTRELKENPIMSYMESLGERVGHIVSGSLVPSTYETWIGIREDEPARLRCKRVGKQTKTFPLAEPVYCTIKGEVDLSCDKNDVLDFWSEMPFDLDLPEHLGNCVDCHKKSDKKLKQVYADAGEKAFVNSAYLDAQYSKVKAQTLGGKIIERKRFRGYRNTVELIASFKADENVVSTDSGCETSCEPFMDD